MELNEVVPWGRSLNEYREMFALSDDDLMLKILGCGDGPASFNSEVTRLGGNVVSVDPIYVFSSDQIRTRIDAVYSHILNEVAKNKSDYVWKGVPDVDTLGLVRMEAMQEFLADFAAFKESPRYLTASLPDLPFEDDEFDLALCSHYLFLYSEDVGLGQHILSARELCRVAAEVRIYPLLSMKNNEESPHLRPVMEALEAESINASLVDVDYEFQRGATKMLVAKRQ